MKSINKFLLGLGSVGAIIAPISIAISCGGGGTGKSTGGTGKSTGGTGGDVSKPKTRFTKNTIKTVEDAKSVFENTSIFIFLSENIDGVTNATDLTKENIEKYFIKTKDMFGGKKGKSGYWNLKGTKTSFVMPKLPTGMTVTFTSAAIKEGSRGNVVIEIKLNEKTTTANIEVEIAKARRLAQTDLDASTAMKEFLIKQIEQFNTLAADENKKISYIYENKNNKQYVKYFIGNDKTTLKAKIKEGLKAGGFTTYVDDVTGLKLYDIVKTDYKGVISLDGKTKKSSRMQIGFSKKTNDVTKYFLFSNTSTPYASADLAIDAYIALIKTDDTSAIVLKEATIKDYLENNKDTWDVLQYWAQAYGIESSKYANVSKILNAETNSILTEVDKLVTQATVNALVTNYIPGGLTGSNWKSTQKGILFDKPGDQLGLGSKGYVGVRKITGLGKKINTTSNGTVELIKSTDALTTRYFTTYGLLTDKNSKILGLSDKGEWMNGATQVAVLPYKIQVHHKYIGIVLLKFNNTWYMATDLARALHKKANNDKDLIYVESGYWKDDVGYPAAVTAITTNFKDAIEYVNTTLNKPV